MSGRWNPARDRIAELARAEKVPLWRRLAWPLALGAALLARYAAESLRHRRDERSGYEVEDPSPPSNPDFRFAAEALTGHFATEGNRAEILLNGDRIFPAILDAIRAAEESVHLETYVYWRGDIAVEFAEAVCERARAGIACRIILDAIGSAQMRPELIRQMRDAGAHVIRFRPPLPHLIRRAGSRTHRRIIVVDGRVGFTGGVGIADEWTGDAQDPDHWRDTHLRLEGPVVRSLQGSFGEHWVEATGEALVGAHLLPRIEPLDDGVPMQVVRSGAQVGDTNIEVLYYLAIASAQKRIDLTAAYFVPRPPFVEALCNAVDRGVEVRVLVPGENTDKEFVRIAGREVYAELVDCGVEVFEYEPTMLHAKSIAIDGCWASIGTANFDNRSFQLNEELTVCIFDPSIAAELHEIFERDLERSERIDPDRWQQRSVAQRVAQKLTVPLRREL